MKDEELTIIMYPIDDDHDTWNVTCDFSSFTMAQKFYKAMTRDRRSELVNTVHIIVHALNRCKSLELFRFIIR